MVSFPGLCEPTGNGEIAYMRRTIAFVLLLSIVLATTTVQAFATPLSDTRAEAERARQAVAELDAKVEVAAEDYNEAYAAHAELEARVAETEHRLAELEDRITFLEDSLGARVAHMYRTGPLGVLEILFSADSFAELGALWDTLSDMNAKDAAEMSELKTARSEAKAAAQELEAARDEAKAELDVMAARKAEIEAALAERQTLLAGLEDEIARLESEERTRQEAAAAAARARTPHTSRDSGGNAPTRAPRGGVVGIAMQYLGTPYRWGATGPDAFDCSGFTMYVYAQVGVSLPHSSRGQYPVGERVSRAHLQPGDLVFFGRGRIHHVGIYVGNGEYIHSPRTGDVVRVSPLNRGDYVGAARP